jgi:diketogulonate reductase-like aldo/keto reductase
MSLHTMGLDYLDMHLIHWPNPQFDRYVEAWRALVALQQDGLVRSIGVSNFTREHLERIIRATGVTGCAPVPRRRTPAWSTARRVAV